MTNNTYSEEEVESAAAKAVGDEAASFVMAALRRPKVEFSRGQVVADTRFDRTYIRFHSEVADPEAMRPLTLTEHGKAVSDLVEALEWQAKYGSMVNHARKAIEAFNAASGGE